MKVRPLFLIAAAMLLFCIFSYFNSFEKTESSLEDSFLQSKGEADLRIKIVGIDEESLKALGQWPWPRTSMARVIDSLSKGGASVIGIDVMYNEPGRLPGEDDALIKAVRDAGNVILPVVGDFGTDKYQKASDIAASSLATPFDGLYRSADTGHINVQMDYSEGTQLGGSDNVLRKGLFSFKYNGVDIKSFDWHIYDNYIYKTTGSHPADNIPKDTVKRFNVKFTGGPGQYEYIPFISVYNGEVPPDYFKGAIVLIGSYSGVGIATDYYVTPLDHRTPMYGVEFHANVIQQFLEGAYRRNLPDFINVLLIILLSAAAYMAFSRLSPALSAAITVFYVIIHFLAARFIYSRGFIIQLLYPAAAVVVVYLVMLAYRYIEELKERKRITGVFGRYVAPQVVDEIIKGGEESMRLGGVKREITALFVDIRGFTPLSEKMQPEQVVEILNDYLNLTASSIFKYGGTLDKFIGDATMAIFNAPLDLEDHAFKAVQTAWAMKEGSLALQAGLLEKFGRSVQFGIGVNTGDAVVGNIGAKFRMDYTAIGDTVNTAARLESNAKPGQILLSSETYRLVKDRVRATPLGGIRVKGKEQELEVYQLDGVLEQGG